MFVRVFCVIYLLHLTGDFSRAEDSSPQADSVQPEGSNLTTNDSKPEHHVVSNIPELPTSIAKPGRIDNGTWLILFYAPWCEHSQAALPHFVSAVQHIVDNNYTSLTIGKLDVSRESGLSKHFNIQSTPTISMYKKSFRYDFEGEMTSDNLKDFVVKVLTTSVKEVTSREELSSQQEDHPVLFLLVHDTQLDTDWHETYSKLARELMLRATFLYTLNPDIVEPAPAKLPTVLVLKDGQNFQYRGVMTGYTLFRWILSERFIALPTVTMDTVRQYLVATSGRRLVVLSVHEDVSQRRIAQKKAIEAVKKLAVGRQMQKLFQFVLTEGNEVPESLLRRSVSEYPCLFVYDGSTGQYYSYQPGDKGYTESAISNFLNLVKKSELTPEGGPTYMDMAKHLYSLSYSIVQATLTHHPYVGALAVFSMMGVVVFYILICYQNFTTRKVPRASRARAMKAALARKDNTSLRQRHNRQGDNHNNSNHGDDSTPPELESDEDESSKDK